MQEKTADVRERCRLARESLAELSAAGSATRDDALAGMALRLREQAPAILEANLLDLEAASAMVERGELSPAPLARLKLDREKIDGIIAGIEQVRRLPDPLGAVSLARELADGLELYRVACPIGVIAVIFESRPDVLPQIASLAVKSGNAVLLKGGREAKHSLAALSSALRDALVCAGLPPGCLSLLDSREDVEALLKQDDLVDLVIPRGSNELVAHIMASTRIPVIGHADGICHIYLHEDACPEMAVKIVVDAKTQYPSACNSVETLLVHVDALERLLPPLLETLDQSKVELRLDAPALSVASKLAPSVPAVAASDSDWDSEYCDLILSIKTVDSLETAIKHINEHGSGHTDSIVTGDQASFERFFQAVDSAGVYWNASTRFADGFRYGFGAEVGISTASMHPRGPVGIEGLVTYKYKLTGRGHTVADFSGPGAQEYTHRDLLHD
ncbi:MAG: glutamate-5-semialdehyde dehydrogenase [Candidatus Obscuribacterales bacterium]